MTKTRRAVLDRLDFLEAPAQAEAIAKELIITIAAWKGGVGKSEEAKEIAWLFDAVLVDFDWDRGGVTRNWGYLQEKHKNSPLLDSFEAGRIPRPLTGGEFRADLVPSSPDFGANQPEAQHVANELVRWQRAWKRPVVVDTHPGGCDSTYGAISAADIVVVPAPLRQREMAALEGMLEELQGYPLMIVPNMVPPSPPVAMVQKLQELSERFTVPVITPVSHAAWLPRRTLRMAVTANNKIPPKHADFVSEMRSVGQQVLLSAMESRSNTNMEVVS